MLDIALIYFPLVLIAGAYITWIAYYYPATTIALVILLGQVMQFELPQLIGLPGEGLSLGFMNLRLSDPLLFGIIAALILRLLADDRSLKRFITKKGIFLSFFLVFLFFQTVRNIGVYAINTLGEFRTYYQFFLLIPYIVVSTKTVEARAKLFKLLMILSLLYFFLGIMRGSILFHFKFAAYDKWLSGFGSLALLYGLYAFYSSVRENVISPSKLLMILINIAGISMIVISSTRAVWLAGVAGLIFLWISGRISLATQFKLIFLIAFIIVILLPLFRFAELNFLEFMQARLLAFTDYQSDVTASWRYNFWLSTIKQIMQKPWVGWGLGMHFSVYVPEYREAFTTSPHNLYLSMLFQIGVVGFLLYIGVVISIIMQFRKASPLIATDRAIITTASLVLLSVHFYGVAYPFEKEFFTWLYIGLALSYIVHSENQRRVKH